MKTCWLILPFTCTALARAAFAPIPLTSDSFNFDLVVERTAPPPVLTVTTASMETGTNNTGFTWFERGYLPEWPAAGFPPAGWLLPSDAQPDHQFRLAASYKTNNGILIDSNVPAATLTLSTPTAYTGLSFLVAAGNASGTVGYALHHANGTTDTGSFTCPDWFSLGDRAWAANGRVDVATFVLDSVNSDYPRLYTRDVPVQDTNSAITSVDLLCAGGRGHTAIFAMSGANNPDEGFNPIPASGYNQDLVVEATAARPGWLLGFTTASMDTGTANTKYTWYERGYLPTAPNSGLPAAAGYLTNEAAADHYYLLAPNYTENNAVLLDTEMLEAVLTPSTPVAYAALSFLTATANGPMTLGCVVNHADGTAETTSFISPDWFATGTAAFHAGGRISLNNKYPDTANGGPRLFSCDVALTNSTSPIVSITLSFQSGSVSSHAAVLAVSGGTATVARPRLSIVRTGDGRLTITSTGAGRLESATVLNGAATVWQDEGAISGSVTVTAAPGSTAGFYRVVATK